MEKSKKVHSRDEGEAEPQAKKPRTEEPQIVTIEESSPSDKNIRDLLKVKRPEYPISDQFILTMARMRPQDLPMGRDKIFTCHRDDRLLDVLKKLTELNCLSAPVLTKVGNFYGFIDMVDIVRFISDVVGHETIKECDYDPTSLDKLRHASVKDLMMYPISKRNPFHPVSKEQSLLSVLEILSTGVHRVPIVNEKGELVHIVTQSSVIKFLYDHLDLLGAKKDMKIHQMDAGIQYVVSALEDELAIDALKLLKICNVSGLAIVDDQGRLVGVLSIRDIKFIVSTPRWISRLFRPVKELMTTEPVYVRLDDTLGDAIRKCATRRIHRVIVVNDNFEPIGIVSLTDILKELLKRE